jgi:hypothetical protein
MPIVFNGELVSEVQLWMEVEMAEWDFGKRF